MLSDRPFAFSIVWQGSRAFALGPDLAEDAAEPMTLEALAGHYARGLRRLVVATRDQDLRSQTGALVHRFNMLLESRELTTIDASRATAAERVILRGMLADRAEMRQGRRQLLKRFAPSLPSPEDDAKALGAILKINAQEPKALFAHVPVFDTARCDGCQACVTICPTNALISDKDENGQVVYKVIPQGCDGCGVCVAGCLPGAISLHDVAPASAPMEMTETTCRECNATIHWPRDRGNGPQQLCAPCAQHKDRHAPRWVLT